MLVIAEPPFYNIAMIHSQDQVDNTNYLDSGELLKRSEKLIKDSKELIEDLRLQLLKCRATLSSMHGEKVPI